MLRLAENLWFLNDRFFKGGLLCPQEWEDKRKTNKFFLFYNRDRLRLNFEHFVDYLKSQLSKFFFQFLP